MTPWAEPERSLEIPAEAHTGGLRLSRDEQEGRSTHFLSLSPLSVFLSLSIYVYRSGSVLLFGSFLSSQC